MSKWRIIACGSALLNRPGHQTVAAVSYQIGRFKKEPATGSMTISDCSRSINLSFDLRTKKDVDNTIHKLEELHRVTGGALAAVKKYKKSR